MQQLFAKAAPDWTLLVDHLKQVGLISRKFAQHLGLNQTIAYNGGILHDIGKAHPIFQIRLKEQTGLGNVFRHEIASLFFLSLFPIEQHENLIEMVVGHHKSVKKDAGGKGLLDLDEEDEYIDFHLGQWEEWSLLALRILHDLGFPSDIISRDEAKDNLNIALDYCRKTTKERGYSVWRGLLMGADHFASAVTKDIEMRVDKIFKKPNLAFFNRQNTLYPLSLKNANTAKRHTIVIACTGAGKTDFLFRRCTGRIFYTLPFQASINAMFNRVSHDLINTNPDLDIRILHASSAVVKRKNKEEETVLQSLIGSSIKILTPHQLAAIAFGLKGFEALLLDLKDCDVILDEIHTYSGVSQAIVLKLIEVLKSVNCSIHIGTATMPSELYKKIIDLLGDNVSIVRLSDQELDSFNRHIVYKMKSFEDINEIINTAIGNKEKILIVLNTVKTAQNLFSVIEEGYPDIPKMLLHSRFKRGDRNRKEKELMGRDEAGISTEQFNTANDACIVVSTQIVEVSVDINFDIMITEAAPIDALIQRFGRINRYRKPGSTHPLKNIYVVPPPGDEKSIKPYNPEIVKKSFEILPDGDILHEKEIQKKIDFVFPEIDFLNIEEHSVFTDGSLTIDKLTHRSKSILFELLDIDSVSCICEADESEYQFADYEKRLQMEIPIRYYEVNKLRQSKIGNKPFIIPDAAYSWEMGLEIEKIKDSGSNINNRML